MPLPTKPTDKSFGILTLATQTDCLKAIGLALSLRASNPGVPTAIACPQKLQSLFEPYFTYVIPERTDLLGFQHKAYLDYYSPFESTFFFDSDVLVFKPVEPYAKLWGEPAYAAVGVYVTGGYSTFGFDRAAVLRKIGREQLATIEGAGHAFFKKPGCVAVFDVAREVTANYKSYAGDAAYADEDAMSVAMTLTDQKPAPYGDFFSRHISAVPGTLEMDSSKAMCRFIWQDTRKPFEPCMMHFAADEAPVYYTRELLRLFRANGVPTDGLIKLGLRDLWRSHIRPEVGRRVRSVLKKK